MSAMSPASFPFSAQDHMYKLRYYDPTARLIEICSAKAMFPTWPGVRMRKSGLLSPSLPYRCPVSVGLSIRLATTALGPSVVLYTDLIIELKFRYDVQKNVYPS